MNLLPRALGTIVPSAPVAAPRVIAPSVLAQVAPAPRVIAPSVLAQAAPAPAPIVSTRMLAPILAPSPVSVPALIAPAMAPLPSSTQSGASMTTLLGRSMITLPPPPTGGAPSALRILPSGMNLLGTGGTPQTAQAIAPSVSPLPTAVTDAVQQLSQQAGALGFPQSSQAAPFQLPADPQASAQAAPAAAQNAPEKTIVPGIPNKTLLIGGAAAIGLVVLVLLLKD